jgi:hypothetical protein
MASYTNQSQNALNAEGIPATSTRNRYKTSSPAQNVAHPEHAHATTPAVAAAPGALANIFTNPSAPHPYNRPVTSNHDPFGLESHVVHNMPLTEAVTNQVMGIVGA